MSKSKPKAFKPVFDGYFKIYLHDDDYKRAADRAEFVGQWVKSKRRRIMKKDRKFQVTLHIFDVDGNKRGCKVWYLQIRAGKGICPK